MDNWTDSQIIGGLQSKGQRAHFELRKAAPIRSNTIGQDLLDNDVNWCLGEYCLSFNLSRGFADDLMKLSNCKRQNGEMICIQFNARVLIFVLFERHGFKDC